MGGGFAEGSRNYLEKTLSFRAVVGWVQTKVSGIDEAGCWEKLIRSD